MNGTASDSGAGSSGITSVTINGQRANNDTAQADLAAAWNKSIVLASGANTITVVATDGAGNQTTKTLTITYTPTTTVTPARLAAPSIKTGSFEFGITGPVGQRFVIEASSQAQSGWTPISTNQIPAGGSFSLTDVVGQRTMRFYRVISIAP